MRYRTALLAGVVIVLACSTAQATLFLTEDFDSYSQAGLVGQGSWTAHSGAGILPVQVVPAPLPLSAPNSVLLQQGVTGTASGEDVNAPLGVVMVAGEKYYAGFSVIVNGTDPVNFSDYFAHFKTSGNVFPSKVGVGPAPDGQDFTFYIHQGSGSSNPPSSGATAYWPTGFAYDTVHRIVVSYEFSTGQGEVWIDPDFGLGEAGNAKIAVTYAPSATAPAERYAFRQGAFNNLPAGTVTQTVDTLLVGTSWAEVVPEPATLALLALGGLALLRRR